MKLSIFVALVFTCASISAQSAATKDAPASYTMTGCLAAGGSPNTYMLKSSATGPRAAVIVSSIPALAPFVGSKVQITGVTASAQEAEAITNVPKAMRYMDVTAIKLISAACR